MRKLFALAFCVFALMVSAQTVVTIYDIQYVDTTVTDSSSYAGQLVTTYGVVTGVYERGFTIQERATDPAWRGVYVYCGYGWAQDVSVGDSVEVTGTVNEYYGLTEIGSPTYTVLGTVTPISPYVVSTGGAGIEAYEGVLLRVENAACTNADLGYGEWLVDDGSGGLRVDDMNVPWAPTVGDTYNITAPLFYTYSNYKLEPRDSSDIELLYSAAIETLSIYDIQYTTADSSPYAGEKVATFGVVTGVFPVGFFIQEKSDTAAWRGIYVYCGSGWAQDLVVGDSVYVEGTISEYNGLTEFSLGTVYQKLGSTTPPPPETVLTGEAKSEQYEGVLLFIENAVCVNDSLGYGEWAVLNEGSDTLRVDDLGVAFTPTEGDTYNITGNLTYNYGNYKLEPRDSNDIVLVSGIEEENNAKEISLPETVIKSGFKLNFTLDRTTDLEIGIYDVNGRLVKTLFKGVVRAGEPQSIELPDLTTGVFFLVVKTDNGKNVSKFVYF